MKRFPNVKKSGDYLRITDDSGLGYQRDLDGKHRNLESADPFTFDKISNELYLGLVGWTPEQITTVAWFDASDEDTITESGGAVSQLDDKSGNAHHLTQPTGSNQPLTDVITIGGLNALYADTNSKNMSYSGAVPSMTNVMAMCVGTFLSSANYRPLVQHDDSVGTAKYVMQVESNGIQTNFSTDTTTTFNKITTGLTVGSPQIYGLSYDGANVQAFIDGVAGSYNALTGAFSTDQLEIFEGSSTFEFGEWIVFDGSDTDTRQKIEGYLSWKWSGGI